MNDVYSLYCLFAYKPFSIDEDGMIHQGASIVRQDVRKMSIIEHVQLILSVNAHLAKDELGFGEIKIAQSRHMYVEGDEDDNEFDPTDYGMYFWLKESSREYQEIIAEAKARNIVLGHIEKVENEIQPEAKERALYKRLKEKYEGK
jgi:hypothetical protein